MVLVPKVPTCFSTSNLPQCLKIFWVHEDKPSALTALMSSISRPSPISIQKPTLTPLQFHVFHLTHLHNQGLYQTPWISQLALKRQPGDEVSVPAFAWYLQQAQLTEGTPTHSPPLPEGIPDYHGLPEEALKIQAFTLRWLAAFSPQPLTEGFPLHRKELTLYVLGAERKRARSSLTP